MYKTIADYIKLKGLFSFLMLLYIQLGYSQEIKDTFIKDSVVVNESKAVSSKTKKAKIGEVYFGIASFYGNKFNGKKTATGEIFNQEKYTAACNILPLGTWLKVTNLKNGKTVIVRTNDRLHPKMKRIVDLTTAGARDLGYVGKGLTKVKVEVIAKPEQKPKKNKNKKKIINKPKNKTKKKSR